jgi:hypothetical protein
VLEKPAPLEAEDPAKPVNRLPALPVTRPQRVTTVLRGPPCSGRDSNDWWYAKLPTKTADIHQIVFLNLGGLLTKKWYNKTLLLAEWMEKWQADTTMMAELNTFWARIPAEHQWSERLDGGLRTGKRTKLAYNRGDMHVQGAQQFGGTDITSTGSCIHRNLEQGEDPSGLGRWAWHQYHWKDNLTLCVVAAYQPNGPGSGGQHTVYAQHLLQLLHKKDDRDLRKAFCEDLHAQILLWIEAGDQVIVGLDANDNLCNGAVNTMF